MIKELGFPLKKEKEKRKKKKKNTLRLAVSRIR